MKNLIVVVVFYGKFGGFMKKMASALFMLCAFGTAFAQNKEIERAVRVKTDSASQDAIRVYEVERKSETIGSYSSTTIEYMIENRANRILEGEFEFPLQDGESVAGFALDINGTMRDAVVVEKQKGRQVFEEIVRRGVDPGLVEKTEGNNFKTRVYPLPANGVRHLRVKVEKELAFDKIPESAKSTVFTQTIGKNTYFSFYEPVEPLVNGANRTVRSVTVLFDVSSSGKNRDIAKEIAFLKKYIEVNGTSEVNVVTFSAGVNELKSFGSNAASMTELEKFLKNQAFDGATDLRINVSKVSSDEILLFSDGLDNWKNAGESDSVSFEGKTSLKIHTINSSKSANFTRLKKIANETNGVFVNLADTDVPAAVLSVAFNPMRVMGVEFNSKEMADVFPAKGTAVSGGVSVSGILVKKSGLLRIMLGRDGVVERTIERTVSAVDSKESENIVRIWAMKKIAELEIEPEENKEQILKYAKEYSIVTNETSLIVLENVSDYVRYGIVPPQELRAEYDRIVSRQNQSKPSVSTKIPDIVFTKFEEFKKWWKKTAKDFEEDAKEKPVAKSVTRRLMTRNAPMVAESRVENLEMGTMEVEDAQMMRMDAAPAPMASAKMAAGAAAPKSAPSSTTGAESGKQASVALQAWSSNADYISVLKKTATEKMYAAYLELKKSYENSPAFYMEVSDYFAEEGLQAESVRILSNLAELNLENTDILRALGNKLVERGSYGSAVFIFEKLTKLRGEIPQFFRDLALAAELNGDSQKAIDALWHVASRNWDARYAEIQQIALNDMNAIIANASTRRLDLSKIDSALMENFDMDLRIVLTWNTDDCDVDLWVTDPNGEKCFYGHKQTVLGGRMSRDFTQGYGPEEFCIKTAKSGVYKIEANYFGNRQQKVLQPVIVQAEVYTNFGRANQKKQVLTLQLDDVKQTFLIGDVEF